MGFFAAKPTDHMFVNFSLAHIWAIAFLVVSVTLLIIFRNKLAKSKYEKYFLYTITILSIIFEITFKVWTAATQDVSFTQELLPFNLCTIALYLAWFLCIYPHQKWIFRLVYFYSLGALVAAIFPSFDGFGPDHFRYYHFFYTHTYIVFVAIYFAFVRKYKLTFKDFAFSVAVLFVIGGLVLIVNYIFDANYMYLMRKPLLSYPMNSLIFYEWPYYVYAMSFALLIIFVLAYLPWIIINWRRKKF